MWCSSTTLVGGAGTPPGTTAASVRRRVRAEGLRIPKGPRRQIGHASVILGVDSNTARLDPGAGAFPSDCRRPLKGWRGTGASTIGPSNGYRPDRQTVLVTKPRRLLRLLVQAAGQPADADGGPSLSGAVREAAPRSSAERVLI